MNLSKKSEYALKALIELAMHYERKSEVTLIADIARKRKIPPRYLEQILLGLKNSGILYSKRGVGGGYSLNRPPETISLGDIIRAVEGPLSSLHSGYNHRKDNARDDISLTIKNAMKKIDDALRGVAEGISLKEMAEMALELIQKRESVLNYAI